MQDLSSSGPKLGQFTPPKKNPNPPVIHSLIFSFPEHPLKFHMADIRDAEANFKPSLFEELILVQPSSPLFAFCQHVLGEFDDKFFSTGGH